MRHKVMASLHWFFLILSASAVSTKESTGSNESVASSEPRSPAFALADDIYSKQRECEAIIEEAVEEVLNEDVYPKFPVAGESYFQCQKSLNEKKREYIRTALVGLASYSTVFPMRLSSGRVVIFPVPTEEKSTEADRDDFDVQEELCVVNKVCLKIATQKPSNEQSEKFSHCADLLNDLKLKHIHLKKLDEFELKKERGLNVKCSQGAVTFFLPPQINDLDYHTTSHTMSSVEAEIKSRTEDVTESKGSDKEQERTYNPHRDPYNQVVKELKDIFELKAKDEERYGDDSKKITGENPAQGGLKDPSSTSETIRNDHPGVKHDDVTSDHQRDTPKPEIVLPSSENTRSEKTSENESINNHSLPGKEELMSTAGTFEGIPSNTQGSATESPDELRSLSENQGLPGDGNEKDYEKAGSIKTKPGKMKNNKQKNNENMQLMSYRVNVLSKNVDGKVVKIQATGRIKKTETGNLTPSVPGLTSAIRDAESIAEIKTESVLDSGITKGNETKKRQLPESLEGNIIMMENDCKELLLFGEQLLQHKLLSSLINLENQYDECIERLDELKKMYIKNHNLDVMSYKNIFPVTLPSGDQKLVLLPTQFLKRGLVETLSPSYLKSTDVFEEAGLDHSKRSENSKPFEDPALIHNDVFLKNLEQGSAPADTSTLSKVASMLHMAGGHSDKKIAE